MSDEREEIERSAPQPKQDPETFVLRARPRPVVRFRRGLVIGITACVSAGVIGVTWLALAPAALHIAAGGDDESEPLRKATPEALANAPGSYGQVPQLGRPLPGDLGRPILDHERNLPPVPVQISAGPAGAAGPLDAERQRLEAARAAARTAPVMVQMASRAGGTDTAPPPPASPAAAVSDPGAAAGSTAAAIPAGQQRKLDFSRSDGGTVNPHALEAAPSPWTLSAGTVIPASLITGLNSDLPGTVLAQVTENVLDSATGRVVLVPQGARLVGSYDSVVAYGQRRALVVWKRIVFPDGSSIELDKMPATDGAGYAGVTDKVDSHTWRLLKGIALSTLLGVGTQIGLGSGESDLVRAIREAAQQNAARAGDQITVKNLDVQPTITVRPGFKLLVMVDKDLVLRPWKEASHG
jgi:type IV secretion system protein VirB10